MLFGYLDSYILSVVIRNGFVGELKDPVGNGEVI